MPTMNDYRCANLRKLIDDNGGPIVLAERLGYANSSFLVQMVGPSPIRDVSEKTARSYEAKLGLEPGSLDKEVDLSAVPAYKTTGVRRRRVTAAATGATPAMSNAELGNLIQLVGATCDAEAVTLPNYKKFADIVALALADAARNNNIPNQDYIKTLVRLTK